MERSTAKGIIEALLFASEKAISLEEICQVLEADDKNTLKELIEELKGEYESQARGFRLIKVAGGFQVCTHPDFAPWLAKLFRSRRISRFSKPALETLAIVAYRQPVSRTEVESIRGVNVEGVLRTLLEKGMVRIRGRKDSPGRPLIYGTTSQFLEYFGLNSLSELPQLGELVPPGGPKPGELGKEESKDEFERVTE